MPRRIDVELTSERPDGTWTWRAAGAREPRGDLNGGLLPSGAKVGDVLRAEAEFDIEGITVTAVFAPTTEDKPKFERLEILGPQREFTPVTSTLVGRGDRDRGDRGERRGPRRDRPDRDRPDRDRPDRDRPGGDRRPERRDRPARPAEPRGERPARPPRRERPAPPPPLPERPKPKRLKAGRAHRDELLASLTPDRRLIAEQLLKGGVPAVRTALDEQNRSLREAGQPEVPTTNVLQAAEDLMPAVRIADWLDKAEAAAADLEEVSLADLRAVVSSAGDVAREERTKELAATLREALDRRGALELEQWVGDVRLALQHGRVVRALRIASRAPDPVQTLPEDLLTELAAAAGAGMTADIAPDRFATLLDAVAYSPVRREVQPVGVPAEPGDELLAAVRKHAGRTPAIATLFGVEAPPPKERPGRKARPPRKAASPADKPQPAGPPIDVGGRKIPPPPRPSKLAPQGAPSAPGSETIEPEEAAPAPADVVESDAPAPAVLAGDAAPDEVAPADVAPEAEAAAPTEIGEDVAIDAATDSAGEEPDPEINS